MKKVSPEEVVEVLNEALKLDAAAITKLVNMRVPCNEKLAKHPTIQVAKDKDSTKVGMLGIINGIFGANGNDYIYADGDFDTKGNFVVKKFFVKNKE
jgi:hypothetical protein